MANNLKTEDTIFGFTKKSVHATLLQNWHILHYQLWALEFPSDMSRTDCHFYSNQQSSRGSFIMFPVRLRGKHCSKSHGTSGRLKCNCTCILHGKHWRSLQAHFQQPIKNKLHITCGHHFLHYASRASRFSNLRST